MVLVVDLTGAPGFVKADLNRSLINNGWDWHGSWRTLKDYSVRKSSALALFRRGKRIYHLPADYGADPADVLVRWLENEKKITDYLGPLPYPAQLYEVLNFIEGKGASSTHMTITTRHLGR